MSCSRDHLLILLIRSGYHSGGIELFKPRHFSRQLGYTNNPKNSTLSPIVHKVVNRNIELTQEVLSIKSGSVMMDVFDLEIKFIQLCTLFKGYFDLLVYGGRGFAMLDQSEIIEFKTGPHVGLNDKTGLNDCQI